MGEEITIWQVLVVIILPGLGLAFGAVWRRTDANARTCKDEDEKIWDEVTKIKEQQSATELSNEQRFVRQAGLTSVERNITAHIDSLKQAVIQTKGKA